MLCNCVCKRCGNDRFHCNRVLRHCAFLDTASCNIVKEKNSYFITTYQLIGTVRAFHGNTNTVCIRVSSKHKICSCLLGKLQSLLQSCENLRVRVAACGKIAVRVFLFRNNRYICDSDILQDLGYRHKSGTIQRAVNQLQSCCLTKTRTNLAGLDCIVKSTFAVVTNKADQTFLNALCKGHIFRTSQNVCLLDLIINDSCSIICHLAAIRAISLVSIIFSRVMRCGNHNTRVALIVACRKGKGRYRH